MTCIVGFTDKNKKLWMGADSLGSNNFIKHIRKDTKLFRNKKFLIGYTSSFRMGQLLRFKWIPPEQKKNQQDYEYICTSVIDSIRKCLNDNGYSKIKEHKESIGTFLVGYKNKLYKIEDDLQIEETVDKFNACGSGTYFAIGALEILSKTKEAPKTIIKKALEVAEKFNPFVGRPFVIKKY